MKTHTSNFKEQIKLMGKEIDSRITFGDTVLGKDDLNAVTPSYQGAILKSVMKQLDIDSNVAIPIGTILKYEFGLKVNGEYEYINYGNYVVYSVEKQEDTNSYKIICYDKLLYSMLDYVKLPITYPISIRDYINSISTALGLKFANKSETFANYNKQIQADLYDGLGYTFRDVLDELAQVTASTICLNNNDELEIRYITETGDTIDEEFLKDVNVNFGEKFGKVNTIVLSRSGDSDSVYYPSTLPANPYEIKISDNQIMNGNDRADFLPDIYNKLNGLEFYTNDFVSTGICYYDLCDRYSVKVGDTTYSCVMFNDEVLVTQGLEENVYTELPEQTETDYKHASKDDRMINQVYIIAKKNEAEILAVVNTTNQIQKEINPIKDESGSEIIIEDASENPLTYLEIEGKSTQETRSGKNIAYVDLEEETISNGVTVTPLGDGRYKLNGKSSSLFTFYIQSYNVSKNKNIALNNGTTYCYKLFELEGTKSSGLITEILGTNSFYLSISSAESLNGKTFIPSTNSSMNGIRINVPNGATFVDYVFAVSIQKDEMPNSYEPYGAMPSPDFPSEIKSVGYENLFDKDNPNEANVYITSTGEGAGVTTNDYSIYIPCKSNITYTISSEVAIPRFRVGSVSELITSSISNLNGVGKDGRTSVTLTTGANDTYLYVNLTDSTYLDGLMITEGTKKHGYIPYGKYGIEVETTNGTDIKSSVMILNEPLRSLPNGVKDKAYIKNNKLYVDRYVGSVVLDGSESGWSKVIEGFYIHTHNWGNKSSAETLSNYFKTYTLFDGGLKQATNGAGFLYPNVNQYYVKVDGITTEDGLKVWLSTHNTQVDYELAEPYIEEIGEIEMLKTLKGYNNITTSDDLFPIINLTYVRDTIIADYVENHVTELKLTENEIKQSVESVSSSVDGLNTTINRVEEITSDNSQVINIISTNIDKTSGEVREVTTTTGFTFNADGMTIDDGSGFKAQHRATGTYYKDGESIVGQYTKDGSKQKDLELFGTYSYGKENIDDTPMFVGQLYRDENGEECFGHFYNGGDY